MTTDSGGIERDERRQVRDHHGREVAVVAHDEHREGLRETRHQRSAGVAKYVLAR
jgi:hypothetical protein